MDFRSPTFLIITLAMFAIAAYAFIVGIIPLGPGGGLYNTMLYMTQGDYAGAISEGVSTTWPSTSTPSSGMMPHQRRASIM